MITAQHGHLRTTARVGQCERLASVVEALDDVAHAAGANLRLQRSAWRDGREVVAYAATHAQRDLHLCQCPVYIAGARNLHTGADDRLHEAIDHRGLPGHTGIRHDAPRPDGAMQHVGVEQPRKVCASLGRFCSGQCMGDPSEDLFARRLARREIAVCQHSSTDGRQHL